MAGGPELASLLAVALGAVIALVGTYIAEMIRTRCEHTLVISRLRYDAYPDFVLAFVRADEALRAIGADGRDRAAEVTAAMSDSGLYAAPDSTDCFCSEPTSDAAARSTRVAAPHFWTSANSTYFRLPTSPGAFVPIGVLVPSPDWHLPRRTGRT